MTLAQIDALVSAANKANGNGRESREWGTTADLVALATRKG